MTIVWVVGTALKAHSRALDKLGIRTADLLLAGKRGRLVYRLTTGDTRTEVAYRTGQIWSICVL
jgi:hypothetical protein